MSDLAMPEENGLWLARRVRAAVGTGGRRPAMLAITANDDERVHRLCFAAGFDLVLTKPVDVTEFCTVVGQVAGGADRT